MIRRIGCSVLAGLILVAAVTGCGGNKDSATSELAKQREVEDARKQGARDARQSEKIKQLQRELKKKNSDSGGSVTIIESASESEGGTVESTGQDWPGGSAYTVILASLGSESEARDFQAGARSAGLDAGILHSSDYSSLNPGYWVVFSGTYGSSDGAAARASYAKSLGYSDAYPRFVSP